MAKNEVFHPGTELKMSLPVKSTATNTVVSGSPVQVGGLIGVAQVDAHAADADLEIINSNAPGNVTVWAGGMWHLPVYVKTGSGAVGDPVYAKVLNANSSLVGLTTDAADAAGVGKTLALFGHIYTPVTGGNAVQTVNVRVLTAAGPTIDNN